MNWKDHTSYRRDAKGQIPSVWTLQLTREVRISVVRDHRYSPGSWCMHCRPWYDTHPLELAPTVENRDAAMAQALDLVRYKIEKLHSAISEIEP